MGIVEDFATDVDLNQILIEGARENAHDGLEAIAHLMRNRHSMTAYERHVFLRCAQLSWRLGYNQMIIAHKTYGISSS